VLIRSSRVATLLLTAFALLGGEWLGEGEDAPLVRLAVLGALMLAVGVTGTLIHRPRWPKGVAAGVAAALLGCVGFWAGDRIATRAFNSCVERGEEVRVALTQYRARVGHYPDSLEDLGYALPGNRLLRPSILVYERRGNGYVLRFGDWLVRHSATDERGWFAVK
jgi:hypothetical protein